MHYAEIFTVYRAPSITQLLVDVAESAPTCRMFTKWENVTRAMYQRTEVDVRCLQERFRGEVPEPKSIQICILIVFIIGNDREDMRRIVNNLNSRIDRYSTWRNIDLSRMTSRLPEFMHESIQRLLTGNRQARTASGIPGVTELLRNLQENAGDRVSLDELNQELNHRSYPCCEAVRRIEVEGRLIEGECPIHGTSYPSATSQEEHSANRVTIEDVFSPRARGEPIQSVSDINRQSWRNQQAARNLLPRGQQIGAQRRQEEAAERSWRIEWNNTHFWVSPDPDGNPVAWEVANMTDEHLWKTVCWIIQNYINLFSQYEVCRDSIPVALAASVWICSRPIFRALVAEAVRRRLTFPAGVFSFINIRMRETVDSQPIENINPWSDPRQQHQAELLADLAEIPIIPPEAIDAVAEYGRDFRHLDLTDDNNTSSDAV